MDSNFHKYIISVWELSGNLNIYGIYSIYTRIYSVILITITLQSIHQFVDLLDKSSKAQKLRILD